MKTLLPLLFVFVSYFTTGQITLSATYSTQINLVKLHVSGYKYVESNVNSNTITLYNTNHTVFKTITIPNQSMQVQSIGYISENLFDLDNDIEYYVTLYQGSPVYTQLKIYNEDGTLLFQRDSGNIYVTNSVQSYGLYISDPIFFDGVSTRMSVQIPAGANTYYEVYDLPGSVTCQDCMSGIISGVHDVPQDSAINKPLFSPNPASEFIKLNYSLPSGYKKAQIVIHDNTGKICETLNVTSTFEYIYLNSKYANGLYFFDLIVDDKRIKTEKIFLKIDG